MNIAHFVITHLYNVHKNNNKILPFVTKYIDLEGIMLSKKTFLSDQCKEIEGKNRMGNSRFSSRKLELPRKHFMQRCEQ